MLILRVVHGVSSHLEARASEWALGFMLLIWGIQLLQPGDLFAISPAYDILAEIMPENVWGFACFLVGGSRLVALLINGTFADTAYSRYSPHVRAAMAVLSAFFWLNIAISVAVGRPGGTGMAIYPVLLLLDLYNAYRSSGDARQSDEDAKHARPS